MGDGWIDGWMDENDGLRDWRRKIVGISKGLDARVLGEGESSCIETKLLFLIYYFV